MIAPRDARLGRQNMICRWISTGRLSMHLAGEPRPSLASLSDPCLCRSFESMGTLMDDRSKVEFVDELSFAYELFVLWRTPS